MTDEDRRCVCLDALKTAFEAKVTAMFSILIDNHEDQHAAERFNKGFAIAAAIYDRERAKFEAAK